MKIKKLIIKKNGFGLIEVMISSLIMIIVTLSLATALISFLKISQQNNDILVANQIIRSVLENARPLTSETTNAKPSEYITGMAKEDQNFAIDIIKEDISGVSASKIIVIVSKGYRKGTQFNKKRFLSQSAKIFQN